MMSEKFETLTVDARDLREGDRRIQSGQPQTHPIGRIAIVDNAIVNVWLEGHGPHAQPWVIYAVDDKVTVQRATEPQPAGGVPAEGTPEWRLWRAAIEVAAYPPMRRLETTTAARIPWSRIDALRGALDDLGIDWQTVQRAQRHALPEGEGMSTRGLAPGVMEDNG